jgi:glycosyltransferase involved in cell wall biosynthesis
MRINIDVSDVISVPFVSGIQRVVRELVVRFLLDSNTHDTRLLRFDLQSHRYEVISAASFLARIDDNSQAIDVVDEIEIESLSADDIFYDIDAAWNSPLKRSYLYRILAGNGVFIATTLYDLVPIRLPDLAEANTVRNWATFISSVFVHSNLVLPISRATELDFLALKAEVGVTRDIPSVVTKLGGDLRTTGSSNEMIDEHITRLSESRFLLFVGTVEPRKRQLQALQAFDQLAKRDRRTQLIFVGREGWSAQSTALAIRSHPEFGVRVHWIEDATDGVVAHLYARAFACLYLSSFEGYGLPIAEALSRGCVTISSRNSSMYEVGRDLADYTYFDSPKEIAAIVTAYTGDRELHLARRAAIAESYTSRSWDSVYGTISAALGGISRARAVLASPAPESLQYVIVGSDPALVGLSIARLDALASGISEFLIVSPGYVADKMRRLTALHRTTVITHADLALEAPGADPDGWTMLSALAASDSIAAQFVLLRAGMVPIAPIGMDTFVAEDGRHNAYYCGDLPRWSSVATPHDRAQFDSLAVLDRLAVETLVYSSGQPQIVRTSLLREAIAEAGSATERAPLDAWATYFNIAATRFPTLVVKRVYETLGWPASPIDWNRRYTPPTYTFEAVDTAAPLEEPPSGDHAQARLERDSRLWASVDASTRLFEASRPDLSHFDLAAGTRRLTGTVPAALYVEGLPTVITMAPHSLLHIDVGFQVIGVVDDIPLELSWTVRGRSVDRIAIPRTLATWGSYQAGHMTLPIRSQEAGIFRIAFAASEAESVSLRRPARVDGWLVVTDDAATGAELRARLRRHPNDAPRHKHDTWNHRAALAAAALACFARRASRRLGFSKLADRLRR